MNYLDLIVMKEVTEEFESREPKSMHQEVGKNNYFINIQHVISLLTIIRLYYIAIDTNNKYEVGYYLASRD